MVDLMIYGLNSEKFTLSNIFFVLEFILETLSVVQVEEFWQVMETRASDLTSNISRGKPPGTMLIRLLNCLMKRLDPYLHTDLRYRVQLFYLEAFGLEKATNLPAPDGTPLIISEESQEGTYGLFLSVQKGLANMHSTTESVETLESFLENVDKLHQVFTSQENMYRSEYSRLILQPDLLDLQLRDHSFQYKVGVQILLFIEALLQLRPSDIESHNSQKATKHLVWSSLVLNDKLLEKIGIAKRQWYACVKLESTAEQLEAVRLTITHEKEAIMSLISGLPKVERNENFELVSKIEVKTRPKHFHNMGNLQLTNLWKEPLGIDSFVSAKDSAREPAAVFYEKGKDLVDEAREGCRWISLFTQRGADWNSFNANIPPSIGPLFGYEASPRSPTREETPFKESCEGTPQERSESQLTPGMTPDQENSILDTEKSVRSSQDRPTSLEPDEEDKEHKRDVPPAEIEPSPKRARIS